MKQLLYTKGPQGPIGATLGTAMNNFCSSSNKVSTHYITWLFSFWIWRRRCLKFAWFWPFGALPLGPHGGHTYYLNNFESPTPKDDSCQVWLKSNHAFSRRRWKCKKFTDDARRTTHDARRTTDDGRKRTAIAHSSLWLRWANKTHLRFLMDCHFRNLPDFQSSEARLMTASAVHKLSEYCVQWSVYCLTRTYNPGTSLALRFLCSWLNTGTNTCWRMYLLLMKLSLIVPGNSWNRANPENDSP